jgi:hypothetical protein
MFKTAEHGILPSMKHIIIGCVLAIAGLAQAQTTQSVHPSLHEDAISPITHPIHKPRTLKKLKAAPLYSFNEREVDVYLKYLHESEPDPIARLIHLARKEIGQPYEIYLLGEYPYELYDPDPMYCLEKSDCVTFVENMYAMALSNDWPTYFQSLQRLRYKNGKIGMLTRNHETSADWDPNNAWIFDEITASLGDGHQTVPFHLVWKPAKFFAQFGIGQDLKDVPINSVYIPQANITHILPDLRPGDIIHIVRGNAREQYVGHFGLVTKAANGTVMMLHSAEPAVREQALMDFVEKNADDTLGIKVLRPKAELQKLMDQAIQ